MNQLLFINHQYIFQTPFSINDFAIRRKIKLNNILINIKYEIRFFICFVLWQQALMYI